MHHVPTAFAHIVALRPAACRTSARVFVLMFALVFALVSGSARAAAVAASAATAPAAADEAPTLPFAQFFEHPIGPRGLQPTPALRAADGQRVRLVGHMVAQEQPRPGGFLLTPRPVQMSEHADGEADDLPPHTVLVLLDDARRAHVVPHRAGLLALSGRLLLGRHEAADGRVVWVRLLLDADAVVDGAAFGVLPPLLRLPPGGHRHR